MTVNVYDLEARRWTIALSAGAITENGDQHYFSGANCLQKLATLMRKKKGKWAAHYGGGYDHLLMIPFLGEVSSAILTGSRLYSIKFACGVELIDTFPQWLCSLEAVGKYVGLPKLKYDRTQLSKLSPNELKAYNLRDCEIMRLGWQSASDYCKSVGMRHKMTAGSAAIEALRVLEPDTYQAWARNRLHWQTLTTLPNIAPGGFTETFRMGPVSGVHCYDIKSSYPFRYSDPAGMVAGLEEYPANRATWNDPLTVCEASWYLDASVDGVTVAPAKDAGTGLAAGHCSNWLSYDERVLLDDDCRITNVRQLRAFGPTERLPNACKEFQEILYKWKEDGVFFAKVWLNSLHGKFCERCCKDTWHSVRPDESFLGDVNPPVAVNGVGLWRFDKLSVDKDGYAKPHYQPLNGVLVYGRARAHIIRIIRDIQRAGYAVFYCDTDSVFTDCPPDAMARIADCGSGLGQLNYEGGPYSGYILGRKLYYLATEDGASHKIAAKGVPMRSLKRGCRKMGVYVEKPSGKDVQANVFAEIWKDGKAKILRTGVTPFVMGADAGVWGRFRQVRTLQPISSGKHFDDNGVGHYMAGAV